MKKQTKLKILSAFLIVSISFFCSCESEQADTPKDISSIQDSFELKLIDNEICLLNNKNIVKIYEVNPWVLPSEDILLLSEGIVVTSENEADSIAENFDG